MTHLRIPPGRTPRMPLLVIATALTLSTSPLVHAQTPVDANPAPPPPATAPAVPKVTIAVPPVDQSTIPANETPAPSSTAVDNTPAVAPVTPTPSASTANLNIAARDSRTLNPLLIPTDNELREALDYGRALGNSKQDFIDLLTPARRSFDYRKGGMVGEKRRPASTAIWVTPNIQARWLGFLESRTFADQGKRDSDLAAMQQAVTAPQQSLTFLVEIGGLISSHSDPTQQQLDAAFTSLSGTRFVLSDDRGNNYNPSNVATAPRLVQRQSFYDGLAGGPDRLSQTAFGDPSADSRSLVLRRKPYSDYAAEYIVTFDAFNADGSARINRDVHSITLRIITPEEPKFASFDIAKMP
jgi:hypothetical protein